MRRSIARIKGLGFILWHARHEFYHVLLGVAWAWIMREVLDEFNLKLLILAIVGSVLPDIDHFFYFLTYGKMDQYSKDIRTFLKERQWRALTVFIETGHKYNTSLSYHNIYFVVILFAVATISFFLDQEAWVALIGAMVIHYIFDIADDYGRLGYMNANWKRWGRGNKHKKK
jgi:hypothetical protein